MFVNYPLTLSITHVVANGSVGLLADSKITTILGGFGLGVATGVSAEIGTSLHSTPFSPDFVDLQLRAVLDAYPLDVIKTGRLFTPGIINAVADLLAGVGRPVVVDPVAMSHEGEPLLEPDAVDTLRERLVPLAGIITPNVREAELLSGVAIRDAGGVAKAGRRLLAMGAKTVLITGWENGPTDPNVTDWLIMPHQAPLPLAQPRVDIQVLGRGNALATAIAAWMTDSPDMPTVVTRAQNYLNLCLRHTLNRDASVSLLDLAAPLRIGLGLPFDAQPNLAESAGIIGNSPPLRQALQTAASLAPSLAPVLILGETGTGKGLFAQYIHALSGRPKEKFVSVNCAAIPDALLESTLFGHRKGAFTGAARDLRGQFELADGGTLFLDEIAELPLASQVKLLRVLEDGMIQVLGDAEPHKVDVRIIAATNQDLPALIARKAFRNDLYYRLNVGIVRLPSLRERAQDIPVLAQYYLNAVNQNLPTPRFFTTNALLAMQAFPWPGNVRELTNVVERSARLSAHRMVDADYILFSDQSAPPPSSGHEPFRLDEHIAAVRDACILKEVRRSHGNYSEAARRLGLTPQAVSRHMKMRGKS